MVVAVRSRLSMDRLSDQTSMCNLAHDLTLDIRRSDRKYQDMGPCTCCLNRPCHERSHYSLHILVDNRCTDRRSSRASMCMTRRRYALCTRHSSRKVTASKAELAVRWAWLWTTNFDLQNGSGSCFRVCWSEHEFAWKFRSFHSREQTLKMLTGTFDHANRLGFV